MWDRLSVADLFNDGLFHAIECDLSDTVHKVARCDRPEFEWRCFRGIRAVPRVVSVECAWDAYSIRGVTVRDLLEAEAQ